MKIKIFVLYHLQSLLDTVPDDPRLCKINLERLPVGQYSSNLLGEGRAFLSDLDVGDAEYLGFANARWNQKYDRLSTRIENLADVLPSLLGEGRVAAAWPTNAPWLDYGADWLRLTTDCHPSMAPLLSELAGLTGMSIGPRRVSLWANDFFCSRSVWLSWLEHWRRCFRYFHGRYGFQLPLTSCNLDVSRLPAYFYERVTTIYFANRDDLEVVPVP